MSAATFRPTVLTENKNPLSELVTFEEGLQTTPLDGSVRVKLSPDGRTLELLLKNRTLTAAVERPLIHQLGSRAWGNKKTYNEIYRLWEKGFQNREMFEQELSAIFDRFDLVARHYQESGGRDMVYGIVTPNFVEVNQLEFRERFIEQLRQNTGLQPRSQGIKLYSNKNVVEYFDLIHSDSQTKYSYGLIYARNSGYQSYKVEWKRLVVVCTNGLTKWEDSQFRWKHTHAIELGDFIASTIAEGIGHQEWLEERILTAQTRILPSASIREFLDRLSLAKASKTRVHDRVKHEVQSYGANEWALSQALTWLGSHEKAINPRVRTQLTDLGTNVLEKTLGDVLTNDGKLNSDGTFGMVLPTGFSYPNKCNSGYNNLIATI